MQESVATMFDLCSGWKLFAKLWGAMEGQGGEQHMRDLFEEDDDEKERDGPCNDGAIESN
jgi:hypothetical protein